MRSPWFSLVFCAPSTRLTRADFLSYYIIINKSHHLSRSPGSITLLRHYIDSDLIPAGNIAQLLTTLDKADADRKIGADLYGSAATWCRSADAQAMKIAVLEHAVKKFPNELVRLSETFCNDDDDDDDDDDDGSGNNEQ